MTATARDDEPLTLFSMGREAHACRPLSFSPYPLGKRHPRARPTHMSRIPRGTDIATAVFGSELLALPLLPQGEQVAAVLESKGRDGTPLYRTVVILEPRRSTKTTSIWEVLLGRCASTAGYKVVTTAQDGIRARNRFREVARALDAAGFEARGMGRIRWANGDEAIEFTNGSRIWVVPPEAAAFRGEAADVMLFDEAGELSPDKSDDLVAGALPLMDTRPKGQVIITGTPSKGRAGLLWSTLQKGRAGVRGVGILDYSIRDDEQAVIVPDDGGDPVLNEPVLRRVHPGIGTLTTLAIIRERFEAMSLTQFEMEYLCRFPADAETDAISPEAFRALAVPATERPEHVGIAYDCAYDSSSASIAYAWRDESGRAFVEVVEHRLSTSWVPHLVHRAVMKYKRRAPVGYDDIGANRDPAAALERMRPVPRLTRLQTKDIMGAATRLSNEVAAGNLSHFGQSDLQAAIENLTWRDIGKSGRAFGPKSYAAAPINPAVAASLALWVYDRTPARKPLTIAV